MTDQLIVKLKEAHAEELADMEKYHNLHEMAEQDQCYEIAGVLEDIMHDEETHAHAIEYLLTME